MDYAAKCKAYIDTNKVEAEQIVFSESVHTAEEARTQLGVELADMIKTVILWAEGEVVCFILKGGDRVDFNRVRALLGKRNVRMADPEEVLAATGYPVGGVPPFGFSLPVYIDERVMALEAGYAGGGSDRALVRIAPAELVRVTTGNVVSLAQKA